MRHLTHIVSSGWLAMAVAGAAHAAPPQYRVVDVFDPPPYPGPSQGTSAAIGNGPWSAATFEQIGGGFLAFRCSLEICKSVISLEHPGGGSTAADVNRSGAVVGTSSSERASWGYVDDPVAGSWRIPSLNEACPWQLWLASSAAAINNLGLVVGASQTCDNVMHGVLFEAGVMTRIPLAPGVAEVNPADVNDKRVVVGVASKVGGGAEAFSYDGQAMVLLGTLGGSRSQARAVNNAGRIVGCSLTAGDAATRAFVYRRGKMVALPPPGDGNACANDINKDGDVVGTGAVAGQNLGFLYAEGATYLLNDLLQAPDQGVWTVVDATGINNRGEISATALKAGASETKAVRLQPLAAGQRKGVVVRF